MIVITVARKPIAEGTVAGNVIRHGCGAINVDGTRIGGAWVQPDAGMGSGRKAHNTPTRKYGASLGGIIAEAHPGGRWPANVIFEHKASCQNTGTKTIKADGRFPGAADTKSFGLLNDDGWTPSRSGEARNMGLESVPVWICAEGCPVADLDRQSGASLSRGGSRGAGGTHGSYSPLGAQPDVKPGFGDLGGASRFFFTCQNKDPTP